jgi:hypothetical protein
VEYIWEAHIACHVCEARWLWQIWCLHVIIWVSVVDGELLHPKGDVGGGAEEAMEFEAYSVW